MPHSNEFVEFLLEQMQLGGLDASSLRAKAMFGGHGLYMDDLMFALVADDILFFKTASNNLADFEARQLPAFSYVRNGKCYDMSYNEAPSEVLDDPDEMHAWAIKAIDAAVIANRKKPKANTANRSPAKKSSGK